MEGYGIFVLVFFIIQCVNVESGVDDRVFRQFIQKQTDLLKEFDDKIQALEKELAEQKIINNKQSSEIETLSNKLAYINRERNLKNLPVRNVQNNSKLDKLDSDITNQRLQENNVGEERTNKIHIGGYGLDTNEMHKRLLVPAATTSPRPPVIAFCAYMSQNEAHVVDHHIITFDNVQTNVGNGYNKHTGSFIVPQSGVYVFTWTLVISSTSEVCTNLLVNGVIRGDAYGFSGTLNVWQTSTAIVVLHVNKGDTAFVRTTSDGACGQTGVIYGDTWRRSSFAGWLLG